MLEQEIIIYGIAGVGLAVIVIGLGVFIKHKRKEKKIKKYKTNFIEVFKKKKDIRQTMIDMLNIYKKNSAEAKALKAGLYYLDHSMLSDYGTALSYIEYLFDDNSIDELHKKCIVIVWQKRSNILALTDKEMSL